MYSTKLEERIDTAARRWRNAEKKGKAKAKKRTKTLKEYKA